MDFAALGLPVLVGLIAVALLFDFLNGLHDAANSIATIVSTRVLKPIYAVFWAAAFNFIAFLFFGLNVSETLGTGIVAAGAIDARVVFGALVGAIVWNVLTWLTGIPSSSSHALIGGLVGAGTARAGLGAIVWPGLGKTSAAIVLSPFVGFLLALALVLAVVGFRASNPLCGRPHIPGLAIRLGLALLARSWRQRRSEDHGDHRGTAVFARLSRD
jgi:PiT family inorganic phosphate transporter